MLGQRVTEELCGKFTEVMVRLWGLEETRQAFSEVFDLLRKDWEKTGDVESLKLIKRFVDELLRLELAHTAATTVDVGDIRQQLKEGK